MKAFIFATIYIESVLFIIAIRPYTKVELQFQQAKIYLINIHPSFNKKNLITWRENDILNAYVALL